MNMVYVVMGVCGCGKSTIGEMLARKLGLPFYDADAFHPPERVAKLRGGIPLTDADRAPWLAAIASRIREWNEGAGAVLACSALRQRYRELLAGESRANVRFVYLRGGMETIAGRMAKRADHYMPLALLKSQFETLEEPADAIVADIDAAPEEICRRIIDTIREGR
jgi:gluconokinase